MKDYEAPLTALNELLSGKQLMAVFAFGGLGKFHP